MCGWLAAPDGRFDEKQLLALSKQKRPPIHGGMGRAWEHFPYRERLEKVNKWMSPQYSPTEVSIFGWLACARPLRLSTHVCTHHLSPAQSKLPHPSISLREIPSLLDLAAGLRICNPPIRIERGGHRFVAVQTERLPSKAGKVQVARCDIGTKLLHFDPPNLPMKQQLQLFRAHSNRCFRHRRTTGRGAPGLGKRARAHFSCFP